MKTWAELPGQAGRRGLKSLVPSLERERRAPQTSVPASGEEASEKDAASGELPGCKTELRLRELEVCDAPKKKKKENLGRTLFEINHNSLIFGSIS